MRQQLNDAINDALSAKGFIGQVNEQQVNWLKSEGATSDDFNTAWSQFWDIKLIPAGAFPDRKEKYFLSEGVAQSDINLMELEFWQAQLP